MAKKAGKAMSDNDMSNVSGGAYVFQDDKILLKDDDGDFLGEAFIFENTAEGRTKAQKVADYINTHNFTDKNGKKVTINDTAIFN